MAKSWVYWLLCSLWLHLLIHAYPTLDDSLPDLPIELRQHIMDMLPQDAQTLKRMRLTGQIGRYLAHSRQSFRIPPFASQEQITSILSAGQWNEQDPRVAQNIYIKHVTLFNPNHLELVGRVAGMHLKSLHIATQQGFTAGSTWQRIAEWFPRLKNLTFHPDSMQDFDFQVEDTSRLYLFFTSLDQLSLGCIDISQPQTKYFLNESGFLSRIKHVSFRFTLGFHHSVQGISYAYHPGRRHEQPHDMVSLDLSNLTHVTSLQVENTRHDDISTHQVVLIGLEKMVHLESLILKSIPLFHISTSLAQLMHLKRLGLHDCWLKDAIFPNLEHLEELMEYDFTGRYSFGDYWSQYDIEELGDYPHRPGALAHSTNYLIYRRIKQKMPIFALDKTVFK